MSFLNGGGESLAKNGPPYNIRVNAICPGAIDTSMPRKYMENMPNKEAAWRQIAATHLLKRFGTAAEAVYLALYLATDADFVRIPRSVICTCNERILSRRE